MIMYDYKTSFSGLGVELIKFQDGNKVDSRFMQGDDAAQFLDDIESCSDDCLQDFIGVFF